MSRGTVVMLLTNDFVSDPRVEKEALALTSDGWDVTVLAWDRTQDHAPTEDRGPIRIERLGPAAPYGGGARNIVNFREFWRRAAARTIRLAPDVIHCHDLDTAEAGRAALRSLRRGGRAPRLVLDFHELYRESKMVPQAGLAGALARPVVRRVETAAIAVADVIVIANPGTVDCYAGDGAKGRIVLVENAPELQRFSRLTHVRSADEGFRVCFIGQKRYTGGLFTLMEAVQRDERFSALLAGGGVAESQVAQAAGRYERIDTVGRLRYEEIPAYYEGCDCVHAVYDARLGNVRTLFPVKVMEGMACGLPVLVSRGTWISGYVEDNGIGLSVDEADVDEVAEALIRLANDPALCSEMGARGRAIVEDGLNWEAAAARLTAAYRGLRAS